MQKKNLITQRNAATVGATQIRSILALCHLPLHWPTAKKEIGIVIFKDIGIVIFEEIGIVLACVIDMSRPLFSRVWKTHHVWLA